MGVVPEAPQRLITVSMPSGVEHQTRGDDGIELIVV